jgi:O-antigen ligase/tetratricopeptide (TPR) repeat protein
MDRFSKQLHHGARLFTLAAIFAFLYPPRFYIAGFFPRHELLFFLLVALAGLSFALSRLLSSSREQDAPAIGSLWTDWAVIGFFCVVGAATLMSGNVRLSFFGALDRLGGFVSFAYIGALYVLLRLMFSDLRGRTALVKAATVALLLQALYVIAQNTGIIDAQFGFKGGRAVGAFTNPAIVAGYLLFGVFVPLLGYVGGRAPAVGGSLEKRAKRMMRIDEISVSWKAVFLATAVASFFGVMATGTRAAFLGVIFGGLVGAVCIFFDRRFAVAVRRGVMTLLACAILFVSLIGIQIAFHPIENPTGIFSRLTNKSELSSGIRNRALSWEIALRAAQERPVVGWGPDNFSEGFDKHFDSRLVQKNDLAEAWFDKAHNAFLEMLTTMGLLGLGAYVFLLCVLVGAALAMRRRSLGYVPVLALVGAYVANNIFIFDSFETITMLFFVAAWIAPEYPLAAGKMRYLAAPAAKAVLAVLGAGAAGLLAVGAVWLAVLPMRALGANDIAWRYLNDYDRRTIEAYRGVLAMPGAYIPDMWQYLSLRILKDPGRLRSGDEAIFQGVTRLAFDSFEAIAKKYPMTARDYYMAGRLGNFLKTKDDSDSRKILAYLSTGAARAPKNPNFAYEFAQYYRDRDDHDMALQYLNDAIAKDPNVPFTYANLGFTYLAKKDLRGAVQAFDRAFDLGYTGWKANPAYINTFIQLYTMDEFLSDHRLRLAEFQDAAKALDPSLGAQPDTFDQVSLGFSYLEKRDFARAIGAFEAAFDLGYTGWEKNPAYIDMFIQLYTIDEFVSKYLPRLADFYEASIALNPNNAEHYIQLAAIYKELSNYAGARAMAEAAVRLEPSLRSQADTFLRSLEAAR